MIHYLLKDAEGGIVQRGHCMTKECLPVVPGLVCEEIQECDDRSPEHGCQDSYQDYRRMAYPNVGDQLDTLWRLVMATPAYAQDPEAQAMYASIQAVKQQYPKS